MLMLMLMRLTILMLIYFWVMSFCMMSFRVISFRAMSFAWRALLTFNLACVRKHMLLGLLKLFKHQIPPVPKLIQVYLQPCKGPAWGHLEPPHGVRNDWEVCQKKEQMAMSSVLADNIFCS